MKISRRFWSADALTIVALFYNDIFSLSDVFFDTNVFRGIYLLLLYKLLAITVNLIWVCYSCNVQDTRIFRRKKKNFLHLSKLLHNLTFYTIHVWDWQFSEVIFLTLFPTTDWSKRWWAVSAVVVVVRKLFSLVCLHHHLFRCIS